MVLYYKKIKKEPEESDLIPDVETEAISHRYNIPAITNTYQEPEIPRVSNNRRLPENQDLFDELYKTPFSDRKELYYSLLEDNFNSLSLDDKLIIMYKTSISRTNTANNYILMCLALLVIIALKLYSK
tara:strand:- start:17851 stop:18234 length:384 start_codon:yes stop_codon:yes gene_type:complete